MSASKHFETINDALRGAVDDGTVLGVAGLGARPDRLVYEGFFFGKANAQARTPMTPDTVFWLYSMTKTFNAVACMQLVEQGRLDLRTNQIGELDVVEMKSYALGPR